MTFSPTPTEAIIYFSKCIKGLSKETVTNAWRAVLGGIPGRGGVVLRLSDTPNVTSIDTPHDELHQDWDAEEEGEAPLPTSYTCTTCERKFWLATNEDVELINFCVFCGENIV